MATRAPAGLSAGGRALWRAVTEDHDLDGPQRVQLEEACRAKDRLDKLDALLRGDVESWARLALPRDDESVVELKVDQALAQANATANMMKQLLASLRLPDEAGKRPQKRSARGAYSGRSAGTVSSLERARNARAQ